MEAGRRVFTDATQSSICGCKNSIARLLQKDVRRARYLDPRTSRWLSADPAVGEYMAGSNVGQGGIYNQVNFNLYHYAGNNPIKYTDPTGMFDWETNTIEAGDTLSKITDEFNRKNDTNYTYDDMAKANGIEDPNKIYAGDKLDFSSLLQSTPTLNLSKIDNAVEPISPQNQISTAEAIGDILSYISIGLNIASSISILTGNVAIAGGLDMVAAGCDLAATGLYLAAGRNDKAALSLTAVILDFIPGSYKFNKGANRYVSIATGKFVSTSLGKQAAILPKLMGLGMNFLHY